MNNKKGFTLIELLAVIVILAVIALIITPTVNNLIKHAKYGAFKNSVNGLLASSNNYYASMLLKDKVIGTTIQYKDGNLITAQSLEYTGSIPEEVYIEINEKQEVRMYVWSKDKYCAVKSYTSDFVYREGLEREDCELDIPTKPILSGGTTDWLNEQSIQIVTESSSLEIIDHYEYYLSTSGEALIGGYWETVDNSTKKITFTGENDGFIYIRAITTSGVIGIVSTPERIMTNPNIHTITINVTGKGTVTTEKTKFKYGDSVLVTAIPDINFVLNILTYNGNDIKESKTFVMPNEDVIIECQFIEPPKIGDYVAYSGGGYAYGDNGNTGWRISSMTDGVIKLISAGTIKTISISGNYNVFTYGITNQLAINDYIDSNYASSVSLITDSELEIMTSLPSTDNLDIWTNSIISSMRIVGGTKYYDYNVYYISSTGIKTKSFFGTIKCWYGVDCPNSDSRNLISSSTFSYGIRPIITLKSTISLTAKNEQGLWILQ